MTSRLLCVLAWLATIPLAGCVGGEDDGTTYIFYRDGAIRTGGSAGNVTLHSWEPAVFVNLEPQAHTMHLAKASDEGWTIVDTFGLGERVQETSGWHYEVNLAFTEERLQWEGPGQYVLFDPAFGGPGTGVHLNVTVLG